MVVNGTDYLLFKGPKMGHAVNRGMGEQFWVMAEKHGDKPFQIDAHTEEIRTFDDVKKRAIRVALDLKSIGVKPKDMIIVCCDLNLDCIIPMLAGLFLDAPVVVTLPDIELYDARYKISQIKPKAFFVMDSKLDIIQEVLRTSEEQPEVYVIGNKSKDYRHMNSISTTPNATENNFEPEKVNVNDTAFVLFSSGTTSRPKAICMSHFTFLGPYMKSDSAFNLNFNNSKPMLQFIPYCAITSLGVLAASLNTANATILASKVSAEKLLELLVKYEITMVFLSYGIVTTTCAIEESIYGKYDLSKVKLVITGGSYVHPKYIEKLKQIFPNAGVGRAYASTELGILPFAFDRNADKDVINSNSESIGNRVTINFEVKLVDVETGKLVGPNQKGEIYAKSPYRMIGYYNQPCDEQFDEDGFLKTGDLAYYDDKGFFYFCERISAAFKYRGVFVFPSLIEECLSQHPAVKESSVFGVPSHDDDRNHIFACVVLRPGKIATEGELSEFVVKEMGEFHRLVGGVKFFEKFPLTASGKIAVSQLREMIINECGAEK